MNQVVRAQNKLGIHAQNIQAHTDTAEADNFFEPDRSAWLSMASNEAKIHDQRGLDGRLHVLDHAAEGLGRGGRTCKQVHVHGDQ